MLSFSLKKMELNRIEVRKPPTLGSVNTPSSYRRKNSTIDKDLGHPRESFAIALAFSKKCPHNPGFTAIEQALQSLIHAHSAVSLGSQADSRLKYQGCGLLPRKLEIRAYANQSSSNV
jgi:hypothetical protein